jgi:acetyl esterase/lipase
MAAAPITPPPASADDELVYESLPCIRVYKNRVERYFGSEFVPASTDAAVASRDVVISPNVSARLYLPRLGNDAGDAKLPILVYYHGGGFCIGSAFNPIFHAYFNAFTSLAGALVVSVEYRLAPEHPVPAAYADSWDALTWVVSQSSHLASASADPWIAGHADFSRLYLGGDSAGANIAHHMAMRAAAAERGLAHGARIRGLVMVHPYFLGTDRVPSDELSPETRESLASLWRVVCPSSTAGDDDPLINPLVDGAPALASLACARVLVCVAEGDVLRDRGRAYYDRLRASGWPGETEIWQAPDKGHTFHFMDPCCDEAVAQDKVISDFLNR